MKKSGNGTAAIQALYLMVNIPFLHVVKIGISGNVKNRRRNISETTPGLVFPIFVVVLPFAWHLEKSMHRVFRRFNAPFGKHASGFSEWFLLPVAPFAVVIMAIFQAFWLLVCLLIGLLITWILSGCPHDILKAIEKIL